MISDTSVYDMFSFRYGILMKSSDGITTLHSLFLLGLPHNKTLLVVREFSKHKEFISKYVTQ